MGASEIAVHMLEGKDDFLMLRIGKNISVATMPAITEAALQLPVEEFVERYITPAISIFLQQQMDKIQK